jgi:uncharacterized protein YkwD
MPLQPSLRGQTRRRRRGLFAPFAIAAALALTAATPGLVFAWNSLSFSSTDESLMITDTNQARASRGIASLAPDSTLTSIARTRAKYIWDNKLLSHTQKDGQTAFTMIRAAGYCYSSAGENIGSNSYPDDQATQAMFNWFMGSSTHAANILGTAFDHIGVGAYKGNDPSSSFQHVYVMVFADKCASATPTPTPKPTVKPTATPKATPKPTLRPTATPRATPRATTTVAGPTPTPEITPEVTVEPTLLPTTAADPLDPAEAHGSVLWWQLYKLGEVDVTPRPAPSPEASLEPTPDGSAAGPPDETPGLEVIDPVPDQSLLDAIVGGVVSSYFGD